MQVSSVLYFSIYKLPLGIICITQYDMFASHINCYSDKSSIKTKLSISLHSTLLNSSSWADLLNNSVNTGGGRSAASSFFPFSAAYFSTCGL